MVKSQKIYRVVKCKFYIWGWDEREYYNILHGVEMTGRFRGGISGAELEGGCTCAQKRI